MNPFSGCFSSILQIIIIISIFILVSNPLTYMKQISSEKIKDYTKQVKEQNNGENVNYIEIAIIKSFGKTDKTVNLNMNFLGLDLSDIPLKDCKDDPKVFIIPLLYVSTSILSMKLNTIMMEDKKEKDKVKANKEDKKLIKVENKTEEEDVMESMNKGMRYVMPFMTVSIAIIAPLGLALYWFVSNLLMILERLFVNKFVKEEE